MNVNVLCLFQRLNGYSGILTGGITIKLNKHSWSILNSVSMIHSLWPELHPDISVSHVHNTAISYLLQRISSLAQSTAA